jgi:outer membrane protein assembly factor BamA
MLSGCRVSKTLGKDDLLLDQNQFFYNGSRTYADSIQALVSQQPNKRILGIPLRLLIYQSANENTAQEFDNWLQKKPKRNQRMQSIWSQKQIDQIRAYKDQFQDWKRRNGEPPSLIDSLYFDEYADNITTYLSNRGYFKAKTKVAKELTSASRKKANLVYDIQTGLPYYLDTITTDIKSPVIDSLYQLRAEESILKEGNQFNTLDFESERNRLYEYFKNNGVYNFQLNAIDFEIAWDTTGTDFQLPVKIMIENFRNSTPSGIVLEPYIQAKNSEVNVYTVPADEVETQTRFDSISFFGLKKRRYSHKVLSKAIQMRPGDLYSDSERSKTIDKLNRLGIFEYPTVSYAYSDSLQTALNTIITLRPRERFELEFGLDLTQSNIQDQGIAFNSGINVLNIFRGAENFEFGVRGTIGRSADDVISEIGGDMRLRIPKILMPRMIAKLIPQNLEPISVLNFGTALQNNIGLDKQTYNAGVQYQWTSKKNNRIDFNLLDLTLVDNRNVQNYFNVYTNAYSQLNSLAKSTTGTSAFFNGDRLAIPEGTAGFINYVLNDNSPITKDSSSYLTVQSIEERRERLTQNNLIVGSSIDFLKNTQNSFFDENFYQIRFKFESAGNLVNLLAEPLGLERKNETNYLFNLPYSQFVKGEFDYIRHWLVGSSSVFAFRSFIGLAIPLGNATSIPFNSSYFSGGANDNRAWEVYRLGPGSSFSGNEFNEANFKLALNLEYRFDLFGSFKGALFTDVGNIWNVFDDVTDPKTRFDGLRDLSEVAIGTGLGIRYDFGLFIFRLDSGFKTHNPALEKSKRWLTDMQFKKANITIGINYPF